MRYQAPRGTHDVLPDEAGRWRWLERRFADLAFLYGYREIRTPIFEEYDLFARSSGETSEIVSKQMYDFVDKGGRHIALKPEGTAPAIRSYIEHSLGAQGGPTRLWYATPIFRYERPQKGRYRQAHQLGLELIGSASPAADAEVIELTVQFYQAIGLTGVEVSLNCIGREQTRLAYREAILTHLAAWLKDQTEEAKAKANRNPLRLLDSKDPEIQAALKGLPSIEGYLEDASKEHYDDLQKLLTDSGMAFRRAPEIVRGLDYYTDTVFEVLSAALGAQSTLCGGGRYDGLIQAMGGADTPAFGVGMGIERALMVLEVQAALPAEDKVGVFLVAANEGVLPEIKQTASNLRREGIACLFDLDRRTLKAQLKQADRCGADFALLLGESELAGGFVSLKNLRTGEQEVVKREELINRLKSSLLK